MEAALQQVLTRCCGAASLLENGCGSSGLAERAHILGFRHILASDISRVSLPLSTMAYICQRHLLGLMLFEFLPSDFPILSW